MNMIHGKPAAGAGAALFLRVVLPFGAGYFLSMTYRTVNAIAGPDIARDLSLGAAELGFVTSAYFLTFALFQVPLGILLDRYGPRLVEAALLLVAATGAVVFAFADSAAALAVGRGLIGLGVSACLMAAMKANALWFTAERVPTANGVIIACGGLGALAATAPAQFALAYLDWRTLFLALGAATVLIAALLVTAAPRDPQRPVAEGWGSALRGALSVFASPVFLRIAPYVVISQATFLAYHGLWTAAWLQDVGGVAFAQVGAILGIATLGIVVGSLGAGAIADRLSRRGVPVLRTALVFSCLFIGMQLALVLGLPLGQTILWSGFALFGLSSMLYFAVLTAAFPSELGGRVITALNMLVFVGAFVLQWAIGAVLDLGTDAERAMVHRAILGGLAFFQIAGLFLLPRRV